MKMEVSEYFVGGGYPGEFSPEKKGGEQFAVDDLLDFSNEEDDDAAAAAMVAADGFFDNVGASSADSSTVTAAVDSCNSSVSCGDNNLSGSFGSRSFGDSGFAGELCVPVRGKSLELFARNRESHCPICEFRRIFRKKYATFT